jgi:hypothetical protein
MLKFNGNALNRILHSPIVKAIQRGVTSSTALRLKLYAGFAFRHFYPMLAFCVTSALWISALIHILFELNDGLYRNMGLVFVGVVGAVFFFIELRRGWSNYNKGVHSHEQ